MHRALAAARGMDIGDVGTPATLEDAIHRAGDRDLSRNELNRLTRLRELDLARHEARSRGRAGLIGGLAGAATSLGSMGLSPAKVGGPATDAVGGPRALFPAGMRIY